MEKQDELFEGSIKRTPRATQTREKAAQRKPWAPPSSMATNIVGYEQRRVALMTLRMFLQK